MQETGIRGPSGTEIWYAFNDFMADMDQHLKKQGFRTVDILGLPVPELLSLMTLWTRVVRQQ